MRIRIERSGEEIELPGEVATVGASANLAEEIDLALRMARAATGAQDLIVLTGAYHGHTRALIEASPYKHDGPGGEGAPPHVHPVAMPDDFRGPFRRDDFVPKSYGPC